MRCSTMLTAGHAVACHAVAVSMQDGRVKRNDPVLMSGALERNSCSCLCVELDATESELTQRINPENLTVKVLSSDC